MEYTDSSSADGFYSLTQNLSKALGFDSGLDSAHVDPLYIQRLMEAYISKPSEWRKYALSDLSRCYTRNLVDKGNGKSNLVGTSETAWKKATQNLCPFFLNTLII